MAIFLVTCFCAATVVFTLSARSQKISCIPSQASPVLTPLFVFTMKEEEWQHKGRPDITYQVSGHEVDMRGGADIQICLRASY